MRFHLEADNNDNGVLIRIPYPVAGDFMVSIDGGETFIPANVIDQTTGVPAEIDLQTANCGSNLFNGRLNYLEFFITPGCEVLINPNDAITGTIRLQ